MNIKYFFIILFTLSFINCKKSDNRDNIFLDEKINTEFDEFFTILKENFINKDSIDWKSFENSVLEKNKVAKDSAIIHTLTLLGNKHTSYIKANGQHLRGNFKKRSKKKDVNCNAVDSSSIFRNLENIAYLNIYRIDNKSEISEKKYILDNISIILKQAKSDYWIIDLRDNTGGAIWPMLVSLLPFYENGTIGNNVFKNENRSIPWLKKDGTIFLGEYNQSKLYIEEKIFFKIQPKKIFVLINHKTMSAGEAAAISLKSLPNVKFIGNKTGGYATNNAVVDLKNSDKLVLTVNYMGDYQKNIYPQGINPDIELCSQKEIYKYIINNIK